MIERTYPNTYPRPTLTNAERRAAWAAKYYLIAGHSPNTWRIKTMREPKKVRTRTELVKSCRLLREYNEILKAKLQEKDQRIAELQAMIAEQKHMTAEEPGDLCFNEVTGLHAEADLYHIAELEAKVKQLQTVTPESCSVLEEENQRLKEQLQTLIDMHGNRDRQGIIETLEALYTGGAGNG